MTDGIYQMQVLVTDFAGNTTTSATVANVKIDNTPPVTSQDDPGQYLRATINLTGTAADPLDPQNQPGSGVDHVDFQVSPAGANTWTTAGTSTTAPYSVSLDTTTLTDGHYDFRTVAYDVAGNQTASTLVTNRLVDNTPPVVQIVDPGANLRGTVLLTTNPAGTNDPGPNASGIVSTSYEVSSDGGATWQPVGASWNTTGGPDGLYDIRATVTDAAGNVSTPSVVTARRVDNTPPSTTASGVPSGYSATDVTVTLTPTDGGSGVSDTLYSIDNGPTQHGTSVLIPAPSNGSNDGSHTISFQSVDVAGNVESPHSVVVLIDATPPACPSCSASDYLRGTVTALRDADRLRRRHRLRRLPVLAGRHDVDDDRHRLDRRLRHLLDELGYDGSGRRRVPPPRADHRQREQRLDDRPAPGRRGRRGRRQHRADGRGRLARRRLLRQRQQRHHLGERVRREPAHVRLPRQRLRRRQRRGRQRQLGFDLASATARCRSRCARPTRPATRRPPRR